MSEPFRAEDLQASSGFEAWLASTGVGLLLANGEGQVLSVGLEPNGRLFVAEARFDRRVLLCSVEDTVWVVSERRWVRCTWGVAPGRVLDAEPFAYFARSIHFSPGLPPNDAHAAAGALFVATRTGVATLDESGVVAHAWRPPSLGQQQSVTSVAASGGKLVAVALAGPEPSVTRLVGADGGSLPSAGGSVILRVHGGRHWVAEADSGWLGWIDRERGVIERVTFCPGVIQSLTLADRFALVGTGLPDASPRHEALRRELAAKDAEARSGVSIVDTASGDTIHWIRWSSCPSGVVSAVTVPHVIRPLLAPA